VCVCVWPCFVTPEKVPTACVAATRTNVNKREQNPRANPLPVEYKRASPILVVARRHGDECETLQPRLRRPCQAFGWGSSGYIASWAVCTRGAGWRDVMARPRSGRRVTGTPDGVGEVFWAGTRCAGAFFSARQGQPSVSPENTHGLSLVFHLPLLCISVLGGRIFSVSRKGSLPKWCTVRCRVFQRFMLSQCLCFRHFFREREATTAAQ